MNIFNISVIIIFLSLRPVWGWPCRGWHM